MTDKSTVNVRELVLDMLIETFENSQYSHLVLSSVLDKYRYIDVKERKFLTRLYEGTVEYCLQSDIIINRYSKVKVKKMKPLIRNLIRMGIYQLLYMDSVPDRAVCNECVKLAKKRGFAGLSGFVNGVLRNIARDKDNIVFNSISEKYSIPQWIIDEWEKYIDYDTIVSILEGFSENRGLSVRVNESNIDFDTFCTNLNTNNIQYTQNPFVKNALWLSGFDSVEDICGFDEGHFQIQDSSAMIPIIIAGIKNGYRILDVCAAPGGKAIEAADMLNGSGYVEARDLSEYKIDLINENICRCKMSNMRAVCMDALNYDEQSDESFDLVIADLPCSGLGVLGKKSDIKYRITSDDILELQKLQRDILSVVYKYVKPGGTLIYSTCTISKMENEDNVNWILDNLPFELSDFSKEPQIMEDCLIDMPDCGYIQLLPGVHNGDGCFAAKFVRR